MLRLPVLLWLSELLPRLDELPRLGEPPLRLGAPLPRLPLVRLRFCWVAVAPREEVDLPVAVFFRPRVDVVDVCFINLFLILKTQLLEEQTNSDA